MSLPQDFRKFFYLAGLFLGDGSEKKFVVGKETLKKAFIEIGRSLNITLTFRDYGNRTPEIVTSHTLLQVLNSLFDYPLKAKSHNIVVSDFVFRVPKSYAASLIKGYFDCDGCVEKGRRAISISSASSQMIDDLHLLLLRFGCIASKYRSTIDLNKNVLYISGASVANFIQEIGFGLGYKMQAAESLLMKTTGSIVVDLLPVQANGYGSQNISMQVLSTSSKSTERLINAYGESIVQKLNKLANEQLAFVEVKAIEHCSEETVFDFTVPDNHNFVAEGMVIHNTTFSDNLLAGAGMLSEELAGKQLALDFHADEQERGITIDSANVSMVHGVGDGEYLINLIDTPGHVDFGGDVTRAMRAVDGAIVLCCAVEGIMPQTETVLRQALKERVKPVLFINKVDRLIREVKLTPEAMSEKFMKIISEVNVLIGQIAPEEYKQKWQVSVQDGSVAFGSAFHNWALSFPYMKKSGLTFKDVITAYTEAGDEGYKELAKKAPIHQIILDMVVKHHPNPKVAQAYRVPKIWHGDIESELGKALVNCDPNGPLAFVVTKIVIDKHAGEVAAGRLFSGTIGQGQEVYMNMAKKEVRIQQVSVYKGAQRMQIEKIPCGNIIGVVGLKGVFSGETVSAEEMEPFEAIKHIFEPVVTKSIEATSAADLPKLVEVLKQVAKEDPTIKIEINEETGENLMSGMGELHLEVIENRIVSEKGLKVKTSTPIVVYRETVTAESGEFEGKSPNKHNKLYFVVEPLEAEIVEAIKQGEIPEMRLRKKDTAVFDQLVELGVAHKESRNYTEIYKGNVLIDNTRGIVQINEIMGLVQEGFEQVMNCGGLAGEPCTKVKVRLMDCKLHEDAIHRGPAQMHPAVRDGIRSAILDAKPIMLEPMQITQIDCPSDYMGEMSKLIQNKRGQLLSMDQDGALLVVKAVLPVAELFGWSSDLRSSTSGRGSSFVIDQRFDKLPEQLQPKIIRQIRQRKGMSLNA
ncbi:MAG: elongation factor EF-2 [Candidatus Woesearchaeota archaeon]